MPRGLGPGCGNDLAVDGAMYTRECRPRSPVRSAPAHRGDLRRRAGARVRWRDRRQPGTPRELGRRRSQGLILGRYSSEIAVDGHRAAEHRQVRDDAACESAPRCGILRVGDGRLPPRREPLLVVQAVDFHRGARAEGIRRGRGWPARGEQRRASRLSRARRPAETASCDDSKLLSLPCALWLFCLQSAPRFAVAAGGLNLGRCGGWQTCNGGSRDSMRHGVQGR